MHINSVLSLSHVLFNFFGGGESFKTICENPLLFVSIINLS